MVVLIVFAPVSREIRNAKTDSLKNHEYYEGVKVCPF